MALFSSKKKVEKTEEKKVAPKAEAKPKAKAKTSVRAKAAPSVSSSAPASVTMPNVLVRPRITEKAANLTASNVYTFDVVKTATKTQVAQAVKALYKVTPVKVNIVNVKGKRVAMRRKRGYGKTASSRKAYVYLKKGEEIQFA